MEFNLDYSDPWISILVVALLEGFKKLLPKERQYWTPWLAIPLAVAIRSAWVLWLGGETDLETIARGAGSAGVGVLAYAMQRSIGKSLERKDDSGPTPPGDESGKEGRDS